MKRKNGPWKQTIDWTRQALDEFLAVPLLVVTGFILLAVACYLLDSVSWSADGQAPRHLQWLSQTFGDIKALSSLLGTITTGLFTITSITFSLLLLTVQQAGASFTNQVFSQFLRRTGNQLFFGYFVGLSIFVMVSLVVANGAHRPVFAASLSVVLTAVALFLLVLLTYTTINQMRSHSVVDALRIHVLKARAWQMRLLGETRRASVFDDRPADRRILSQQTGYATSIAVDDIARAVRQTGQPGIEVELDITIGDYVAYHDLLAGLRCDDAISEQSARTISDAVIAAVALKSNRDLDRDPAYGLEQLGTIGWTIVSTARSNPYPGLLICRVLRDILARWAEHRSLPENAASVVVYRDRLEVVPLTTLETMIVAASESMQPQTLAAIMRTLATLLPDLSPALRDRIDDIVRRSLSTLGDHVLTGELETALDGLVGSLRRAGHDRTADEVAQATQGLGRTIGALNARSTRAQAAKA